jgi:putative transposase
MSVPERRAMVERPGETLSVRRQCELLNLARSGVYRPGPVTGADDLALMRRIDELHLKWRFTARGEWCSNSTRPAMASTASACKG